MWGKLRKMGDRGPAWRRCLSPRSPLPHLPHLDRLTSQDRKEGRRGGDLKQTSLTPGALFRCTFLSDPESGSAPHSGGFFGESLVPQGMRLPCAALAEEAPGEQVRLLLPRPVPSQDSDPVQSSGRLRYLR